MLCKHFVETIERSCDTLCGGRAVVTRNPDEATTPPLTEEQWFLRSSTVIAAHTAITVGGIQTNFQVDGRNTHLGDFFPPPENIFPPLPSQQRMMP